MADTTATPAGLGPLVALLDVLADGVAVLSPDLVVHHVNPAAVRLLHLPAGDLAGRDLRAALTGAPELLGVLEHAGTAGAPVSWRGRYPPCGAVLAVTAVCWGNLLHVVVREDGGRPRGTAAGPVGADPAAEAERERLRYLAQVTETMIGTLDTGTAAAVLAELVVPRLCDWAVVVVRGEDGRAGQEGRAHRDPARRADVDVYREGRLQVTSPSSPMVTALLTGEPVQLAPLDQARIAPTLVTPAVREAWRRLDATSATIVPLRARGETFGAIAMMNAGSRLPHTPTAIALAVEVARRGALALDNARLYGRQLSVAETLQRSLLTPPPRSDPDHLRIAVRYRPASSHQAVGGDWYDAYAQPDGAIGLVIGDVVGHNVEATAAMSQVRSMLRGLAHDRPGSPAAVLGRLDRALAGLHVDTMATALVARVERPDGAPGEQSRMLRWSSAGHVPPLLLRRGGGVEVLGTRPERLLGAGWTGPRTDHEARLHPGDTLLLVTDGLVEHGRCDIDRGMTRLTVALGDLAGLPVEELCDRLLDRIVTGRADDDIALLALRCRLPDDLPDDLPDPAPGGPSEDAGRGAVIGAPGERSASTKPVPSQR